jgi:uncharacterized membrane protein YczE
VPRDRPAERLLRCVAGLVMCGAGIAAIVHAELGLAPWDVLHQGVAELTGLPIGTVIIVIGGALLVTWIPLHVRPGLGTILNTILIGVVVDLVLPRLPETDALAWRTAALLAGLVLFAVGTGLYIGAGLGPGPRDGLMTGLAARGWSVRIARTTIEVAVLVVGMLLGGAVGVGTAAFAFGIGPLVHVTLPWLRIDPPPEVIAGRGGVLAH